MKIYKSIRVLIFLSSLVLAFNTIAATHGFTADTIVETLEGNRRITDLSVGDRVLVYYQASQQLGAKVLTELYQYTAPDVMALTVQQDKKTVPILTTERQRFYVKRNHQQVGYWVAAKDLTVGEKLLTRNGTTAEVAQLTFNLPEQRMFNIAVQARHNYFVSPLKVLVHNPGGGEICREGDAFIGTTLSDPNTVAPEEGPPINGYPLTQYPFPDYLKSDWL